MQVVLRPEETSLDEQQQRTLDRGVRRLEAAIARYARHRTRIDVETFDRDDGWTEVQLELLIPADEPGGSGETLVARALGLEAATATEEAFAHLFQQFDEYRWRTNPALRARVLRRARTAPRGTPPPKGTPEDWQGRLLREAVPVLHRVALHEIIARQLQGDLEPGWVDPMELVDEALADALPDFASRGDVGVAAATARLTARLLEVLDRHVAEYHLQETEEVPWDEGVADYPEKWWVSDLGREIMEWWVPDTDLSLDEFISEPEIEDRDHRDAAALDPAAAVEEREVRHRMFQALFQLPDDLRRVFSQVALDGWTPATVAAAGGGDEAAVRRRVREAADQLARVLGRDPEGVRLDPDRVFALYQELGTELRDLRAGLRHEALTQSQRPPAREAGPTAR